jgi:hypothetical protein
MATDTQEFRDLADDITEEFAGFGGDFYCESGGTFDPVTETFSAGPSYTVNAIKSNLKYSQFQNQLIQVGDFNLVINPREVSGNYFEPEIGSACKFKGVGVQIISKRSDSSDGNENAPTKIAVVKLVCRYL